MSIPKKKKLSRGEQNEWDRTGGAVGDPTMEELDQYNQNYAGVDASTVKDVGDPTGGDPNSGVSLLSSELPGSEV